MNRNQLRALLEQLGIRPSRRLGQHFLLDSNLLDALVRDAAPQRGERLLEIGPGPGLLTERLLAAGAEVTAVEFDHRFAEYLRVRFAGATGFRLIEQDACRVDYSALFPTGAWRSVANLPYRITGPLLAALCLLDNPPERMHFLVQREAAGRLCAAPGTAEYGPLSVLVQFGWRVERLRAVPPEVFFPPPRVRSAFIALERRADFPDAAARRRLHAVVRPAFQQRRKGIAKVLRRHYRAPLPDTLFSAVGVASTARAGELSPADFARLAEALPPSPKAASGANSPG